MDKEVRVNRRLVVIVVSGVLAAGPVSAFAQGSVVQSGVRLAQQAGLKTAPVRPAQARSAGAAQGTVASSGMSKGKKILVALGVGLGVLGAVWAIDHGVEDVTPSSLGLRKD